MVAPAMDRPSFLILGAARCGTTTLHHALGQHPDVLVSTPREPRFFEVAGVGLERYRALFPADRIRVLLFDDLRRDPAALLRELCRFLGVDPEAAPRTIRAENAGLGTAEAAASRLALRLHLRRLVGRGARTRVRARLSRLGARPRVPEPARRWLVEPYAPHNAALERLLGRDLSAWRGRPAPAP
jgi:hypothetical protein